MSHIAITPSEERIWQAYYAVKEARLYVEENEPNNAVSLEYLREAESSVWDAIPFTYVW